MGKKKTNTTISQANPAQSIINTAQQKYEQAQTPTATETKFGGVTDQFTDAYTKALSRQTQDYGNLMTDYSNFRSNLGGPTNFSFQKVSAERPEELGEAYGYLREAMPGYRDFASTGGYSDKDIQELRARGINPIRSAYGNTMRELDRARAIGGNGGAPNYIAALSRAQRELPEQLANATTEVNAKLADAIRQGKMFGLQGISGTGSTMGNLSSAEAGRMLQAALANQAADLQAQELTEKSRLGTAGLDLNALGQMGSLYGTSPGMASTFGNQALNAYGQLAGMENARNTLGLNLLGTQLQGVGAGQDQLRLGLQQQQLDQSKIPWWQRVLSAAGTVVPILGAGGFNLFGNKAPVSSSPGIRV